MVKEEIAKSTAVGTLVGTTAGYATKLAIYSAGFTKSGVTAGSAAAVIQSSVGNVAAGSLFSTFQYLGVAGIGLQVGCVVGIGVGGWYLTKCIRKKYDKQK